jgi:RimJ/RimL family protein N-acetyltransferase
MSHCSGCDRGSCNDEHANIGNRLYYALSPARHRRGYATEAVRAMIDYAFRRLRLRRIIATTTYNNEASMGVMRKVGMCIEKNPFPDPPWLQVVGVLEAPSI